MKNKINNININDNSEKEKKINKKGKINFNNLKPIKKHDGLED